MTRLARPHPCFLDTMEPIGAVNGEKRWRSPDGRRLYTWDSFHGEIEVFNRRGRHLAVLHAVTGVVIKGPIRGRNIDV